MNDSKTTAAPAGQSERAAKWTMSVLLQGTSRACRHWGLTEVQHKPGCSSPSHQTGLLPFITGLLICKCFPAITRDAPLPASLEGTNRRICNSWILSAILEFSLLSSALAAPGPSSSTHPWCSWIAFHPRQFYTNKVIWWSQHGYESLHTFLGWNTNCLTWQSKWCNRSQNGSKEAVSN